MLLTLCGGVGADLYRFLQQSDGFLLVAPFHALHGQPTAPLTYSDSYPTWTLFPPPLDTILGKKFTDLNKAPQKNREEIHYSPLGNSESIADVVRNRNIVNANAFRLDRAPGYEQSSEDGSALFVSASYFNHSCIPNAIWTIYNNVVVFHAFKPVECGKEATVT
ncbi:hypothetical protein BV898_04558 [Hypsibius exemplaris]|uniref:SET domain-containing protein n=1 Tax=Hypsibius exemplaris TaxID=2072580 RepID=A0A1W0X1I5_HYPEX|nr:hypothetical protein BV898_04558 [Hypsibius exemplaris]